MKVASELPNTTTLSHLGTKALVLTRILSARQLQLLKIFQTSQRWEILEQKRFILQLLFQTKKKLSNLTESNKTTTQPQQSPYTQRYHPNWTTLSNCDHVVVFGSCLAKLRSDRGPMYLNRSTLNNFPNSCKFVQNLHDPLQACPKFGQPKGKEFYILVQQLDNILTKEFLNVVTFRHLVKTALGVTKRVVFQRIQPKNLIKSMNQEYSDYN